MKFKDYFKLGKDKEQEAKDLHQQASNLYEIYYDYIENQMDNYDKDANISVIIYGYNYFNGRHDEFGCVDLYGPYAFNNAEVTLVWQPLNRQMVEIWNGHVFINGVEKGKFDFDPDKSLLENYKQFLEKRTVERIKGFDYKNLENYII